MASFRNRLLGGDDEEEIEKEIDHWELRFMRPGSGRWEIPKHIQESLNVEVSNLDEPLNEKAIQATAETESWPAGKYKMQSRYKDGTMGPTKWTYDHETDEEVEPELTTEEQILRQNAQILELLSEGGGRVTEPDQAYGRVFEAMMGGEEVDPETAGALRAFLQEWQATTQDAPSSPGEFAGRIAQDRYKAGDDDGATKLLAAWFQAEQPGDTGGLLAKALDGEVAIEGDVGLLELAGLDAYTRMEPALDRIAGSLGDQAADAVAGEETDNLLANALAAGSHADRGTPAGGEGAADRAVDVDDVDEDVGDGTGRMSPEEVAELSEGYGRSGPPEPDAGAEGETADSMTPTISDAEAADVAARVAGGD